MNEKNYNEELRQKLEVYRSTNRQKPLTMSVLATELGVSATRVNKYLVGKPEGNVEELEARIADLLKAASTRMVNDIAPFETNVTQTIKATFELIRKTNDVGLISGPAGVGKTMSVRMYLETHPTTLAISVPRWLRNEAGFTSLLFNAGDNRDWNGITPRAVYLVNRLRNSNRLIIIDNAQRLTAGARAFIFDFHDETGCPIAMLGNPEVLHAIRKVDQHFSRIGIYQEVKIADKSVKIYAKAMVDAIVKNPAEGLYEVASAVTEERGHLRALKKQLLLALDLAETKTFEGDQVRAFHAAHQKLVRDYQL